jgi:hypothetical protein
MIAECKGYAHYMSHKKIYGVHVEITTLCVICNIRVCVHLENYTSIEIIPEKYGRKIIYLLYTGVTDALYYGMLQDKKRYFIISVQFILIKTWARSRHFHVSSSTLTFKLLFTSFMKFIKVPCTILF